MHRASVSADGGATHQAGGAMHGESGATTTVALDVVMHSASERHGVRCIMHWYRQPGMVNAQSIERTRDNRAGRRDTRCIGAGQGIHCAIGPR